MTTSSSRSLKADKEAFVTGYDGSTPWEVLLVCASAPISVACHAVIKRQMSMTTATAMAEFVLEAILVWCPMILCQTNYLYPYGVGILFLQLGLVWRFRRPSQPPDDDDDTSASTKITPPKQQPELEQKRHGRLDYVTNYRSAISYLTFIAILAVDFPVFPRRFCKTEVAGYGLMDVGAACFCLSGGLVSRRARRSARQQQSTGGSMISPTSTSTSTSSTTTTTTIIIGCWTPLLHTLPLLVIGAIRILTNQELDYQEHVSEYGVHWNFFFTLGVLATVPVLLQPILPVTPTWILPTVIMIMYQLFLTVGQGQDYIETSPRECHISTQQQGDIMANRPLCHLFAANREGILGCIGYLSLFWMGEWIGYRYVWCCWDDKKKDPHSPHHPSGGLAWLAVQLWMALVVLTQVLKVPVSRRSTNLAFCVWAAAHNVILLAALQYVEEYSGSTGGSTSSTTTTTTPLIWKMVNQHGLLVFLIANLLTGLVNLTVPTLEVSDPFAVMILMIYLSAIGLAAVLLDVIWSRRVGAPPPSTTTTTTTSGIMTAMATATIPQIIPLEKKVD